MTLYLFNFNNYYNRIVKKYDNINSYGDPLAVFSGINFIPNNGISTTQIVNYEGEIPDYLIVEDENNNIVSRWYVTGSTNTRNGQELLSLYRDLIADWYDEIIDAPCFIEKASLPASNPLIFNHEDMTFNQIKQSEYLLKDNTGCPWIVGYVDKKFTKEAIIEPVDLDYANVYNDWDEVVRDFPLLGQHYISDNGSPIFRLNWYNTSESNLSYCFAWNIYGESVAPISPSETTGQYLTNGIFVKPKGQKSKGFRASVNTSQLAMIGNNAMKKAKEYDWFSFNKYDYMTTLDRPAILQELQALEGTQIKVGEEYYELTLTKGTTQTVIQTVSPTTPLGNTMLNIASYFRWSTANGSAPFYQLEDDCVEYSLGYKQIASKDLTLTIDTNRLKSRFSPYDIFCIPYGEFDTTEGTTSAEYGLKLANALMDTTQVYDVQLVPYCPLQDRIDVDEGSITRIEENGDQLLAKDGITYSAIYWVDNPEFSFTIDYEIAVPTDATEIKVSNDCDVYRLCSPNYNGQFEFSPLKNGGVAQFNVDCSYKPYTPYIKIAPTFSGLYGRDFDDARGLICGGDFSLTQHTDQWKQYQVQNKNYQVMFNREIQNIDVVNNAQRKAQNIEIATGILSAGGTGAMAGAMLGGGWGALVGSVIGGGASLAGGFADWKLQETLREEARDYRIDQFGYQLGNIQALPASLTKVSSLNNNNKLFPFVEFYTSTDIEKLALRDKIKYNGMTVMTIGTISQYITDTPKYIKGKLIRLENANTSSEVVNAIANELYKGVFI